MHFVNQHGPVVGGLLFLFFLPFFIAPFVLAQIRRHRRRAGAQFGVKSVRVSLVMQVARAVGDGVFVHAAFGHARDKGVPYACGADLLHGV